MTEEEFQNATTHRAKAEALKHYEDLLMAGRDGALKQMRATVPKGDVVLAEAIALAWIGVVTAAKDAAIADFGDDVGTP